MWNCTGVSGGVSLEYMYLKKNLHLFYVTYYVAKSQQLPSIGEREQAGNHLAYRYHGKVDWAN